MSAVETRRFGMHANLLYDVIHRQAGTLAKAILEAVMNAVDAGATKCTVKVENDTVYVADNGRGFRTREEILRFFEVFGQPHSAAEQKTYGNFRMGRGQLFAFGVNIWRTGNFRMEVDVKHKGLDYELATAEFRKGCRILIELYSKLLPSQLDEVIRDVRRYVKWVNIPVTLNGEVISHDPAQEDWEFNTELCYGQFRDTGDLAVYNLGVFVKEYPSSAFGVGGEVVSRAQLRLNFPRNDIMQSECPIWRQVRKYIDERAGRTIRNKPLTDGGRQRLADQLRLGLVAHSDLAEQKLLTDVTGRHWPISKLFHGVGGPVTVAPKGDRRGDKLHQAKMAFVLAEESLHRFQVKTVEQLLTLLAQLTQYRYPPATVPFAEIAKTITCDYDLVPQKLWTPKESIWVHLGGTFLWLQYRHGGHTPRSGTRDKPELLYIGDSRVADGWTDGSTYIAISRRYLAGLDFGSADDLTKFGCLMLHEYCHDGDDRDTHVHGVDFYQSYHDLSGSLLPMFVHSALIGLPTVLANANRRITKKQLRQQDRLQLVAGRSKELAARLGASQ